MKKSQGSSLIDVLISLVLISFLSVGVLTFLPKLTHHYQAQQDIERKQQQAADQQAINLAIADHHG